jgi:glucose-6-phosphate-specific signal transduction histidine kinase
MATTAKEMGNAEMRAALYAGCRHIAVVAAYAACYTLLRDVSVSHWNLTSGLRVLCLLLVPYRYWAALAIGEALPLAWLGWSNHERFGLLWAAVVTVPPILLSAPVFAWCRRYMTLFRAGQVNVTALLSCILAAATVSALANTGSLALVQMPPGEEAPAITTHIVLTYFLGSYLGALTLAPAFLAWRTGFAQWQALVRDGLVGVLPALLALLWLASAKHGDEVVQISRMAMFLPVAWLAVRYGWQGAAIGGTLASVAVQLTVTVVRDPAAIQAQALIAFAMSSLLILGARVHFGVKAPPASDADSLRGFQLARQGLYQEEQRLRHVAESLDQLGQSIRDGQHRMVERLRPLLPASMEHGYARHLEFTQMELQRLANALHPRAWRERGLKATFMDGPLAQASSLAGADYVCDVTGSGLDELAPDVHMMLYRQACELLVYLLAREPMRRIQVQIRGGCTHGRRWVVLRLTGTRAHAAQRGRSVPEWRQLVALLGTNGQGMATVRERALIYGGVVHERESHHQLSVALLLHDAPRFEPQPMESAAPLGHPESA